MKIISRLLSNRVVLLILLAAFDQWLFITLFHINYPVWYLKNGAIISILTAGISLAWGELDRQVGLISPNPTRYFNACLQLIGLSLLVFGIGVDHKFDNVEQASPEAPPETPAPEATAALAKAEPHNNPDSSGPGCLTLLFDTLISLFDSIFTILFLFTLAGLMILWLVIVTPMQYVVNLVCGAPGRKLSRSSAKIIAAMIDDDVNFEVVPRHAPVKFAEKKNPFSGALLIPKEVWEVNLSDKPIAVTNMVASLVFFILSLFLK